MLLSATNDRTQVWKEIVMDPVTGLATIIGLISIFKQERKAQEDQNREAFFRWLDEHRHQDLKEFIIRTKDLSSEIDRVLHEDHAVIIGKIEKINEILATLLSRVDGVAGIAQALNPNAELSDQAVSILRQLVESGAQEFGKIGYSSDACLPFTTVNGSVQIEDSRFLDDDLNTLVNLGLLLPRTTAGGTQEFYGVTRNAVRFLKAINA